MVLGTALAIGATLMGSNEGAAGARSAYKRKRKYYRNAQGIITRNYGEARDTVSDYSDRAQTYQDPYLEMGEISQDYFKKLNAPGGISNKYKEYLDVGDPIFDYANKKTEEALQKKLAASGRLDSGRAIEEELDRSSKIAYDFSDLADRRVQNEVNLYGNLMNTGQRAADTSTQLQYNTGGAISNLYTQEGQLNSQLEAGIGDAAADYASAVGNINMNKWGNIAGNISPMISGLQGMFNAGGSGGSSGGAAGQGVGLGNFQLPQLNLQSFDPGVITQQVQQNVPIQPIPQQVQAPATPGIVSGNYDPMIYQRTANINPLRISANFGYSSGNNIYNGGRVSGLGTNRITNNMYGFNGRGGTGEW
jgi:hypothetical protein